MSISGLSNQLRLVVAIITTLLVGSSLFRSACAATDSHEFTDSRQFKKNLAVSRHRNNTYWLPNYTWKPLEKSDAPRKKPIWESKQQVVSEEDKKKRLLFDEWHKKMRQVTIEQRKKWKTRANEGENVSSDKNKFISSNKDLEHTMKVAEPKMLATEQLHDGYMKVQNSLHNGQRSIVARNTSEDPTIANSIRTNSRKPVDPSIFPEGRWGMSIKEAPKKFLNEISKSNIREPRISAKQEQPESLNNRLANEVRTTSQPSVVVTFPPGRWGIDVKEPPTEFLKEIEKKLLTLKIDSKAEEEKKNAGGGIENRKLFGTQVNRGERRNIETGGTSIERSTKLSNGRWSMRKSSFPREFLREISTLGHPAMEALHEPTMSYEPDVGPIPMHDPRSRQSIPFQNSLMYKMLLLPQSVSLANPIVPGIRCVVCQS